MRRMLLTSALALLTISAAVAQESNPVATPTAQATPPAETKMLPAELQAIVKRDFGDDITIDTAYPVLEADFNGDGTLDVAIVVHTKGLSTKGDYKMIDPYDEYFGYGGVKITSQFETDDPLHKHALLIIHGNGAEGWRAKEPKEKFVVINMPFDSIKLANGRYKKKTLATIATHDNTGLSAILIWTGKKYHWEPGATDD
jgi:hypothetical protein